MKNTWSGKPLKMEEMIMTKFENIVGRLTLKGYSILEAHFDSERVCIIFNKVYKFNEVPKDFIILETVVPRCDDCYCDYCPNCDNYSDLLSILVYSEADP